MRKMKTASWAWILAVGCGSSAFATDPWEADPNDNGSTTRGHILPGQVQVGRDLQGGPVSVDQDWLRLAPSLRHSYEARVTGGPVWAGSIFAGARLDRVDQSGVVLTAGTEAGVTLFRGQTVRWIAASTPGVEHLRALGDAGVAQGPEPYVLELFDTTYAIPRWNNSAGQVTIFLMHNTGSAPVNGSIFFYSAGGALLHTEVLAVPGDGLQVLNTASIGALANQSGAARIAHTGGPGALAGKAVSLEPATGFTFDTAMTAVRP